MFDFVKKGKIQYIIVGLGNPGKKYEGTRHNTGFDAVEKLAADEGLTFSKHKFSSLIADGSVGGVRCLLLKPQTFMNNSGEAIVQAAQYYNVPNENILVLYDDVSLDVGKMRIRRKGSAGGHNGIKSIVSCISGEDFPRIKIGVGKKPSAYTDLADWVLGKIPADEREKFDKVLPNAAEAARMIVSGDIDKAMNLFNS